MRPNRAGINDNFSSQLNISLGFRTNIQALKALILILMQGTGWSALSSVLFNSFGTSFIAWCGVSLILRRGVTLAPRICKSSLTTLIPTRKTTHVGFSASSAETKQVLSNMRPIPAICARFSTGKLGISKIGNCGLVYPQKHNIEPLTVPSGLLRVINRAATNRPHHWHRHVAAAALSNAHCQYNI